MKDSAEYSKKVRELYRQLKRKLPKVQKINYENPIDAVVYGVLSEHFPENTAHSMLKRFSGHFVDWNDLRVSRPEEIVSVMGTQGPQAREIAEEMTGILRTIFDKYNTLSLENVIKQGKKLARQILEKLMAQRDFVIDYVMLTCLHAHAVPVSKGMIERLKKNELVHSEASDQEIAGFLTRQVSGEAAFEFYMLLRKYCESNDSSGSKAKSKSAKTAKSKAAANKK